MIRRRTLDKAKVAAASRDIIEAEGLQALTFGRVAKVLHVKSQSIYNYFHNLQDLLEYIGADLMRELYDELTTGLIGLSGKNALIKYGEIARSFFLKQGKLLSTLYVIQNYSKDSEFVQAMQQVLDLIERILSSVKTLSVSRTTFVQAFVSQVLGFTWVESMGFFDAYEVPHNTKSFQEMLEIATSVLD